MIDIGFFELLLISLISLIVLGPDRLPHAIRMLSAFSGKLKRTWLDLKLSIEAELPQESDYTLPTQDQKPIFNTIHHNKPKAVHDANKAKSQQ